MPMDGHSAIADDGCVLLTLVHELSQGSLFGCGDPFIHSVMLRGLSLSSSTDEAAPSKSIFNLWVKR